MLVERPHDSYHPPSRGSPFHPRYWLGSEIGLAQASGLHVVRPLCLCTGRVCVLANQVELLGDCHNCTHMPRFIRRQRQRLQVTGLLSLRNFRTHGFCRFKYKTSQSPSQLPSTSLLSFVRCCHWSRWCCCDLWLGHVMIGMIARIEFRFGRDDGVVRTVEVVGGLQWVLVGPVAM